MAGLILHHYDTSPFSEKVRLMFGLKGLSWDSVQAPVIMPKPDLVPLTGGYRRIPVLQIRADVYCDTQVILAEIERRRPAPPTVSGAGWAVNFWADRLFFGVTVPIIFGELGDATPKAFLEDREKLSGRPFNIEAMKAAAGILRPQWRAQAAWIEAGLARSDWLDGAAPGLSDIAAYMNIWFLGASLPHIRDELLTGLTRTQAWRKRVAAIGHGTRREIAGADALADAKAAEPAAAPVHDAADPLGLPPGTAVTVAADDYGRDPIAGVLVAATPDRVVIARDSPELGKTHIHFPRAGYYVGKA
ncbi:glutathione S-transferase family protein [Phenylobacterium sp.]|uniref:glutathione S-transferase family protein n=1 Tax=Phenylobacterium sp. TaxID=1871053 RepID=UPI00286B2C54|nr:glutathione S-transferase family protein [Phenylobacterium sp.]